MSLPIYPIWLVDTVGAGLMIVFSFLCVSLARRLRRLDPQNVVWTYLLWLCYGLACFAISRSVGHIAKRLFLSAGYGEAWEFLQPYTGAINTFMFVLLASVTLFFERVWKIYQQILKDKQTLQETHRQILFLNRNLESLIAERTRELALSEKKYRRIFEVSRDMILVADAQGKLLDVNPAGRAMLGLDDFPGDPERPAFQDFFHQPGEWTPIAQALDAQGYVSDTELELTRRDDSRFSALLSGSVEGESADAFHFLVKDISRRKTMEKQLLQADKLASIGQLAAGIAHEINNPLGMILGYTQLLLRTEPDDSQQHADLKIIEKHARNCKTIVGDLLSFARSTRTRKGVAHLHAAMDEVVSVVQHHFELDGVRIEKSFDPQLPAMTIDEEKMKQVFMNLIMNAKQAIGKKGTVWITTHYDAAENRALIEVRDTGSGIAPEHLSRIFDPFFTTKPTGEGTGLGLSVSYGIVKDHGGDIAVESQLGSGSSFRVTLPVTAVGASKP